MVKYKKAPINLEVRYTKMDKLRIACCGGWHAHAKHFPMQRAKTFCSDIPHEFVAIWDDNIERGQQWADEMGVRFEPDYDKLCEDKNIDAFIITAGNLKHAQLVIKAANAGKHIFMEKPLGATLEEAYAERDAVKKSGVHFTLSDPVKRPPLVYAKKLMDDGVIGKVTSFRYHIPHGLAVKKMDMCKYNYMTDEVNRGVMTDMGHHAVHTLYWFLGKPQTAIGAFGHFMPEGQGTGIDDNSAIIYQYEGGVLGIVESGWVNPGNQNCLQVYGTKGFITADSDGVRYCVCGDKDDRSGTWTKVDDSELPPAEPYALRFWMLSILNDTPDTLCGIDESVILMEMIDAAYRTEGRAESIEYK
jgi:predicted dehydrogenase